MHILHRIVKNKGTAIRQLPTQIQMIPLAQFQQNLFADLPQIPRDDQIKVQGRSAQILHVSGYGLECGRGKCQV